MYSFFQKFRKSLTTIDLPEEKKGYIVGYFEGNLKTVEIRWVAHRLFRANMMTLEFIKSDNGVYRLNKLHVSASSQVFEKISK